MNNVPEAPAFISLGKRVGAREALPSSESRAYTIAHKFTACPPTNKGRGSWAENLIEIRNREEGLNPGHTPRSSASGKWSTSALRGGRMTAFCCWIS